MSNCRLKYKAYDLALLIYPPMHTIIRKNSGKILKTLQYYWWNIEILIQFQFNVNNPSILNTIEIEKCSPYPPRVRREEHNWLWLLHVTVPLQVSVFLILLGTEMPPIVRPSTWSVSGDTSRSVIAVVLRAPKTPFRVLVAETVRILVARHITTPLHLIIVALGQVTGTCRRWASALKEVPQRIPTPGTRALVASQAVHRIELFVVTGNIVSLGKVVRTKLYIRIGVGERGSWNATSDKFVRCRGVYIMDIRRLQKQLHSIWKGSYTRPGRIKHRVFCSRQISVATRELFFSDICLQRFTGTVV